MLASYRAVRRKLPAVRVNSGGKSLFEASVFHDLTLVALIEAEKQIQRRKLAAGR
jgi:hypothetical protein